MLKESVVSGLAVVSLVLAPRLFVAATPPGIWTLSGTT
jgi:hypothetical protein